MAGASMGDKEPEDVPALRRLYIDFAHSISIGVHKEKHFLLINRMVLTLHSALLQWIVLNQRI